MNRLSLPWRSTLATLPVALLLALTAAPLAYLVVHATRLGLEVDWPGLTSTLRFAVSGAAIAVAVGSASGMLFATREFPGRAGLLALSFVPIAAPPAFWWIGVTRLTSFSAYTNGPVTAALVAGLALAPVSLLLVWAALRQLPANLYEAARVALPPGTRVVRVLVPLLWSPLAGGFVLTVILLLGESELPFLFGFRTTMTDIVTTFAQSFGVARTLPLVIPLLVVILVMGVVAAPPLQRTLLASSRGGVGVVRRQGSLWVSLSSAAAAVGIALSAGGYLSAIFTAAPRGWSDPPIDATTIVASILEPVGCAWIAVVVTLVAGYPARRSGAMPVVLWTGLMLFCVPSAIYAIGWLALGQTAGGLAVPPGVAFTSRGIALAVLGFVIGSTRIPASLEDAAALVAMSPIRRAWVFIVPLLKWPLAAAAALIAAITFADRDVPALLLAPGASRLTLNLYLASANAPSVTISVLALSVIVCAFATVVLAAAGPTLLLNSSE